MGTPKFRAYDHATKRMVYSTDENIAFLFDKKGWIVAERIPSSLSEIDSSYKKVKVTQQGEGELMRFSGRQTISEDDIYEGDIVCLIYEHTVPWQVMFHNDRGFYLLNLTNRTEERPLIEECNAYEGYNYIEITGNIYQK